MVRKIIKFLLVSLLALKFFSTFIPIMVTTMSFLIPIVIIGDWINSKYGKWSNHVGK